MVDITERDRVVWLHRRAGFGLPPADLDAAIDRGAEAELERLLDPTGAGAPGGDLWDDAQLPIDPQDQASRIHAIGRWLALMVATDRPVVDRMAWLWHGHFVSGLDKVRIARLMVEQVRLFRRSGLGPFRDLVRAVTIDPAMLVYLDLRASTGLQPNENYARELMELFTLGEGEYGEADVKAAAAALTGWTLRREDGVQFVPSSHDDSPQHFLGVDGVHDLDTVLDALLAHPALPRFVTTAVVGELLGAVGGDVVDELAAEFVAGGLDVRTLVRATLRRGLDGGAVPVVLAPVPWIVQCVRITGSTLAQQEGGRLLRDAGQLPMLPPNVAGWPGGAAWLAASGLVARANLAELVARTATDPRVLAAAGGDDLPALAGALGLPAAGFSSASAAALAGVPAGRDRLAVALVSPEFVVA